MDAFLSFILLLLLSNDLFAWVQDEKDRRIRELTVELYNERQRCKRQCAAYQEQLNMLLKYVEEHTEHMSRSVENIVQRVRELENENDSD